MATLKSSTIDGNTVWTEANDGSNGLLDADDLKGYGSNQLVQFRSGHNFFAASNLPVGWYTVATNAGNRAGGRFGFRDQTSSRHQHVDFYCSHHFGSGNLITILNNSLFGTRVVSNIRLKEGGTYDGCMIQLYIANATNNVRIYELGDNGHGNSWVLKNWVPDGTNPGGVNNFSALTNTAAEIGMGSYTYRGLIASSNQIRVYGSVSKSSGSFDIPHPDPNKSEDWRLRHGFIESPNAGDNIYRYTVDVIDISKPAVIQLPDYWKHLNENPQIWINACDHFGQAYAEFDSSNYGLTIHANKIGKYNLLLIGTRKDKIATENWNSLGVEYDPKKI